MPVPVCRTVVPLPLPVCRTDVPLFTPPDSPVTPCVATGAGISTLTPQAIPADDDTEVDFTIDDFETPPSDADSANNQIVIGVAGVYTVAFTVNYSAAADGPATARIRVGGISFPEGTFVHQVSGVVPTQQVEQVNVSLNPGDEITLTIESSVSELEVTGSLAANALCGPSTGVVVQG